MNKEIKHGIYVTEHKHWNTKTIYSHGAIIRSYRHQPKHIKFKSPMVNDFNQHLCGGWSFDDIKEDTAITQLVAGNKPFACVSYWPREKENAIIAHRQLTSTGLISELRQRHFDDPSLGYVWDLLVCHNIRVMDIGDLQALCGDYTEILGKEEIMPYAEINISKFFDGWDTPPLPLWLTGLILGYPIENTISIYLEQLNK